MGKVDYKAAARTAAQAVAQQAGLLDAMHQANNIVREFLL